VAATRFNSGAKRSSCYEISRGATEAKRASLLSLCFRLTGGCLTGRAQAAGPCCCCSLAPSHNASFTGLLSGRSARRGGLLIGSSVANCARKHCCSCTAIRSSTQLTNDDAESFSTLSLSFPRFTYRGDHQSIAAPVIAPATVWTFRRNSHRHIAATMTVSASGISDRTFLCEPCFRRTHSARSSIAA